MSESKLRYLQIDFESHRTAIIDRIQSRWPTEWNDFLSNSIGMVIVDIMAWSTATIAYAMHRTLGESFTSSMKLRESAIRIGTMFGYRLKGPSSAKVKCLATIGSAQLDDIVIKAGTSVLPSGTDLIFEVDKDYTISAGYLSPENVVLDFVNAGNTGDSTEYVSSITIESGSRYADVDDTSIDLRNYAEPGQHLDINGGSYTIAELRTSPSGVSYHRMVLSEVYTGLTLTSQPAKIVDRRIGLVHGQTVSDSYTIPAVPGSGYTVRLSRLGIVEGSIRVSSGNTAFEHVDSLLETDSATAYELRTIPSGYTLIKFSSGVSPKSQVVAEYRVGGGSSGNVSANSINATISANLGGNSPVSIKVTNAYSSGSGGLDRESVEDARVNIPNHVQANRRAVSLADYAAIASEFSGSDGRVKYARAETRSGNSLVEGNIVVVYAWTSGPDGITALSGQLKSALQNHLKQYAVGTDYPMVMDGVTRQLPVCARVKTIPGFSTSSVKLASSDALKTYISNLAPGSSVPHSELFKMLGSATGVDQVSLATPTSDLSPSSANELFVNPTGETRTVLEVMSETGGVTTYQIPIYPVSAWGIRLFRETSTGVSELKIYPAPVQGNAVVVATSTNGLSMDKLSLIDTKTGKVTLVYADGALPTDISFSVIPISVYERTKVVDVWIGYDGINNQPKRREIRAAVREWSQGLSVGGTLYAYAVASARSSVSNIKDVVASISGVDSVTRVALVSPSNESWRVDSSDVELIQLGQVFIQNSAD